MTATVAPFIRSLISPGILLAAVAAVLAVALAEPLPVAASCIAPVPVPQRLATAPLAFVGIVQSVAEGGRVAQVRVESIWVGPDIHRDVTVDGRLSAGEVTSVDRVFEVGARLLFFPQGSSSPFADSACSGTVAFDADLAALKPAGARDPQPGGDPVVAGYGRATFPWPAAIALTAGVVIVIGLVIAVLRARHRRP